MAMHITMVNMDNIMETIHLLAVHKHKSHDAQQQRIQTTRTATHSINNNKPMAGVEKTIHALTSAPIRQTIFVPPQPPYCYVHPLVYTRCTTPSK
mmetsp:Transcript_34729/g.64176  ORF Transcript_34729/g.64176 Transcript_34729/m.64176 type:complete len:95 (+) Transcript_34729:3-287(+)